MSSKLKRIASWAGRTRSRCIRAVYRTTSGVRPEHPESYATHQPILIGLARLTPIRRVLELGSGPFSSAMFLNRDAFPDLEALVSYEDVPEWRDKVLDAVGEDDRLDLRLVEAVHDAASQAALGARTMDHVDDFDLVFIDNSGRLRFRKRTMKAVGDMKPQRAVVVIHDFEWKLYRRAITERFDNVALFDTFTPQTGVAWNGSVLNQAVVDALRAQVERLRTTDVTDTCTWSRALAAAYDPPQD